MAHLHACATAGINVALVKYWGKRDAALNLPAVGSLSLTLAEPGTKTNVTFCESLAEDRLVLNSELQKSAKISGLLNGIREIAGLKLFADIESTNTVPTAAGLASSASGFAALGLAAWSAAGLPWNPENPDPRLLDLVRIGSGSAPRSLFGGFVLLDRDSGRPHPLHSELDVALVVTVLSDAQKSVSSRDGMTLTAQTSPYYPAFVAEHEAELKDAQESLKSNNFKRLGEATERSTIRMHACMWASNPPLRYLTHRSLQVIEAVESLRQSGLACYFTIDAGPHVKVLCLRRDATEVCERLKPLADRVSIALPGHGARLIEE